MNWQIEEAQWLNARGLHLAHSQWQKSAFLPEQRSFQVMRAGGGDLRYS